MNMKRKRTVATLKRAGRDQSKVVIMSFRPRALGTSLMIRNTRNTRNKGMMVRLAVDA